MSNLAKAMSYAKMGIRVFPCKANKAPRPRNGYHEGTVDLDKITKWWKRNPDDMIGGVCDSTFTVIDVDCGGVCPEEQKDIILNVVDELKLSGFITESTPCVATKSGGFHYYLSSTDSFTRKINYLPAIDLLASGGYVILPDNTNYRLVSGVFDVEKFEPVNGEILEAFHDKYDETRLEVKYAIDVAKGKNPRKPKKRKGKTRTVDMKEFQSMYDKNDSDDSIDPTDRILDNGKIHIDQGMLSTDLINTLFFNQEIQKKLAKFLGLRVPSIKKTSTGRVKGTLQRSILVGHKDSSPSMGVRWATVDSHILARDFSDHHGDGLCDYNVVRLYMNKMYGKNIAKPSKPEWVTWFVRMLFDAEIIDIKSHLPFIPLVEELFQGQTKKIKAAESIFLLDALKKLHSNYSGEFPVTKSFMDAWCKEVHKNTSYNTLKELVANGFLEHTSTEKLSEKRNLFLYKVNIDLIEKEEYEDNKTENEDSNMTNNSNETNTELKKWLDDNKNLSFSNIGELDKAEGDKLDWSDDAVEWEVFDEDVEDVDVNNKTPPS